MISIRTARKVPYESIDRSPELFSPVARADRAPSALEPPTCTRGRGPNPPRWRVAAIRLAALFLLLCLGGFVISPAWAYRAGDGADDTPAGIPEYTNVAAYLADPDRGNYRNIQIGQYFLERVRVEQFHTAHTLTDDNLIKAYADVSAYLADSSRAGRLYADIGGKVYEVVTLEAFNNAGTLSDNNLPSPETPKFSTVAVGKDARAQAYDATAVGQGTLVTGDQGTAVGQNAHAYGYGSVALGDHARAYSRKASALGRFAHVYGRGATGLGDSAYVHGERSTAVGMTATALGERNTALGYHALAAGQTLDALGSHIECARGPLVAVRPQGFVSQCSRFLTAAETQDTRLAQDDAAGEAFRQTIQARLQGVLDDISTSRATAVGDASKATAEYSTALGSSAHAGGDRSTALGSSARATGDNAIAIGSEVTAGANEVVIGSTDHAYKLPGLGASQTDNPEVLTVDATGQLMPDGGELHRRVTGLESRPITGSEVVDTALADLGTPTDTADQDGSAFGRIASVRQDLGTVSDALGTATDVAADDGSAFARIAKVGEDLGTAKAALETAAYTLLNLLKDQTLSGEQTLDSDGNPVGTTMNEFQRLDEAKGNAVSSKERLAYLFQALYGKPYVEEGRADPTTDSDTPHENSIAGRIGSVERGESRNGGYEEAPEIGSGDGAPVSSSSRRVVVQDTNRDGSVRLRTLDFSDLSALDRRIDAFDKRVDSLDERLDRATAMSSALSALPNVVPNGGRFYLGAGVGHYADKQALAIGMSARLGTKNNVFVNAGVATASGAKSVSARGGIGFVW